MTHQKYKITKSDLKIYKFYNQGISEDEIMDEFQVVKDPVYETESEFKQRVEEEFKKQKYNIKNRVFHQGFVGYYEKYQHLLTSAPTQFATHLIIQLMGHAIGYDSFHSITPERVPHNTYIALLGMSSITKKSTAQDIAKQFIPEEKILPSNFSPEALLEEMAQIPHGMLHHGEFSGLLRNIKGRGYLAWFKEISNDLFRCINNYRRKLKSKDITINNPYFSQCTTGTPEQVINNIDEELLLGGFVPRFILVYGEGEYRERDEIPLKAYDMKAKIEKLIVKIYRLCEHGYFKFKLSKEAKKQFNSIDKKLNTDNRYKEVLPFVARYSEYIIVYADIIELSKRIMDVGLNKFLDNKFYTLQQLKSVDDKFKINMKMPSILDQLPCVEMEISSESINEAWSIIEPSLEYAKELCQYVLEERPIAKIIRALKQYGKMPHGKCLQYSHLSANKFNEAINTLEERGDVKVNRDNEENKATSYEYIGD